MSNFYGATSLTGAGTGALDAIDGDDLIDGDGAVVITNGISYQYTLDTDSGETEVSPQIIKPDDNAGTKRWILNSDIIATSPWIDVRAYGVIGDGVADDTSALQAAFSALAAGGKIVIPEGTYNFNDTLTIAVDDINIDCRGTLNWTKVAAGTAIMIGDADPSYRITGNIKVYNTNADNWATVSTGVMIQNCNECNIRIDKAENFRVGVYMHGLSNGCAYNQITLGRIVDNQFGLYLNADATGWVNENIFYGGRFTHFQAHTDFTGSRHVMIVDCTNPVDNNRFICPSFESAAGRHPSHYFYCNGTSNYLLFPRNEGTPTVIPFYISAAGINNVIKGGYGFSGYTQLTDLGTNTVYEGTSQRRWRYGNETRASAAPTTGTWGTGDICWNWNGTGYMGWVCITTGTPGTWVPFGMIQATNAYTTSNVSADRAFDANTVAVAELADVVGTLIADLKVGGLLK